MNQHINISKYRPLRAGSYLLLPKEVRAKKAIVNAHNEDNDCLRWSLRAALFLVDKDPQRATKYPLNVNLNFKGVDAPTPLSQITRVENQTNLSINVYEQENGHTAVYRLSKNYENQRKTINLFLATDGEKISLYMDKKPESFVIYSD